MSALLDAWGWGIAADDQSRILGMVNAGVANGETTDVIASKIFGSGTMRGTDGVTQITRRDASTIAQTAIANTASDARGAYVDANSDIINTEVWVATLDGNTCEECAALDGQQFAADGSDPDDPGQPPLHANCRCDRVPALDGEVLGSRPAVGVTEDMLSGLSDTERAAAVQDAVGQVPASLTYQNWLENQASDFQDEVLGPMRAQLFRDGMPLTKFINSSGDLIPLDELLGDAPVTASMTADEAKTAIAEWLDTNFEHDAPGVDALVHYIMHLAVNRGSA